ncbi:hypothetical protein F4825DRAFT_304281 [Nemania diffusa]|nr:hypothetical protein F4825DRAFT_304281 [Nemania diffusa]
MMRMADGIVLIDHGHATERGTYTELIGKPGKFAELVNSGVWVGHRHDTTPKRTSPNKFKTPKNSDLPLRSTSTEVVPTRRQWVGTCEGNWTPNTGPSTAIQSPYVAISRLSMPKKRREHKPDDDE